ncbi:hypothetical protein HDV00_007005 [Rhizophlyctis rosea]|nr:hypothetical protein HDV00_007005 [Rhizophlyctis rosea]
MPRTTNHPAKLIRTPLIPYTYNGKTYHFATRYKPIISRPTNADPILFHQTIAHSDGSTFTIRSTSPRVFYQLTKDVRNHPLWNPSIRRLDDDSGSLARFSQRFAGMGDLETMGFSDTATAEVPKKKEKKEEPAAPAAGGKKKK